MNWLSLQNQFSACNYRVKIIFMGSPSDESVFMIVKYYGNTALKIVLTKPVHSKIWILNCNENRGTHESMILYDCIKCNYTTAKRMI